MFKKFLVIAVVLSFATAACDYNSALDRLQAGSISFTINSKVSSLTTKNYQQSFSSAFSSKPSIAFSLQSISVNSAATRQWSVSTDSVTPTSMGVNFEHIPNDWTSIRVGFWASSREDIALGQTAFPLSLKTGSSTVVVNFNAPIANPSSSIMRVFVTGYTRIGGEQLDIQAFEKAVGTNFAQIFVQVGGDMEISGITINYIIFDPLQVTFASYGGFVNERNFGISKLYSLHKTIYRSEYNFYGLASINFARSGSLGLSGTMDADFYLRIDSLLSVDSFTFIYVAIGVPPAAGCANCAQKYLTSTQCVAECPSNSFSFTYPDGGKGCRVCPIAYNMVVNSARNDCTCRTGFSFKNGLCALNIQIPQPTTQQTPQQAEQISEQITQPTSNYANKDCSSIANSYWTGYRCACRVGFHNIKNICVAKDISGEPFRPAEFIYKISLLYRNTPQQCNGVNEIYNGESCVCAAGHTRNLNGVCSIILCPANSNNFEGLCRCNDGYQKVGEVCVPINVVCPQNSHNNGLNECVCNQGYQKVNGNCVEECFIHSNRNDQGVCICVQGYKLFFNPSGSICVTNCGDGLKLSSEQCDDGNINDGDGCSSACNIEQNFACQGTNPSICHSTNTPYCGDGFINQANESCDDKNVVNNDGCFNCVIEIGWKCQNTDGLQKCECDQNYEKFNEKCVKVCQLNNSQRNSEGVCVCSQGYVQQTSPSGSSCVTVCGDGIRINEQCDDGNTNNGDGCSSACTVEQGFNCNDANPSVCTLSNLQLQLMYVNTGNVFVQLQTSKEYTFASTTEMRSFMKYEFKEAATEPSSAYCLQNSAFPKQFDCLLIYPSGVPNYQYSIRFFYNHEGDSGQVKVDVDPLSSAFSTRSLN